MMNLFILRYSAIFSDFYQENRNSLLQPIVKYFVKKTKKKKNYIKFNIKFYIFLLIKVLNVYHVIYARKIL